MGENRDGYLLAYAIAGKAVAELKRFSIGQLAAYRRTSPAPAPIRNRAIPTNSRAANATALANATTATKVRFSLKVPPVNCFFRAAIGRLSGRHSV